MKVYQSIIAVIALIISVNAFTLEESFFEKDEPTADLVNEDENGLNDGQKDCLTQYVKNINQINVDGIDNIRLCAESSDVDTCIRTELSEITDQMDLANEKLTICLRETAASNLSRELEIIEFQNINFDRLEKFRKAVNFCRRYTAHNLKACNKIKCWGHFVNKATHIGVHGMHGIDDCYRYLHRPHEVDACIRDELFEMLLSVNVESMKMALCLTHADIIAVQPWPPTRKTTTPAIPTSTTPTWNTTGNGNTTSTQENTTTPSWSTTLPVENTTTEENTTAEENITTEENTTLF